MTDRTRTIIWIGFFYATGIFATAPAWMSLQAALPQDTIVIAKVILLGLGVIFGTVAWIIRPK